jgi:hypothetical protein
MMHARRALLYWRQAMTVSTVVDHNDYTGNGVTTSFPYNFRIFKKTDLAVSVIDLSENITVLVLDTDYTVTNAGGYNGGNVVLTSPLANGWQISIARELEPTQETDLRNQGKFFAEVHEDAFDKLTMLIQQAYSVFRLALRKPSSIANWYDALGNYIRNLKDPVQDQDAATKKYVDGVGSGNVSYIDSLFRRTLRVPESYINPLPGIEDRKNKIPAFDNAGNVIAILPPSGSASDVLIELANQGDKKVGSTYGGTVYSDYQPSIYQKSGLFSAGYLLTEAHQTLYYASTGHWYRYLGTIPVGGLLVNPGSTPDSNWEDVDFNQVVRLRKLNLLSTASIAGYVGVNIDMPVSVTDSDNQGVRVGSGVTIRNDLPTQNTVKTTKIQSGFSVYGDDVSFIGLRGRGAAAADNSATSEFITNRIAKSNGLTTKSIVIDGADASGFTAGIGLYGADGFIIRNSRLGGMFYSPVTLSSAGGYGVVLGDSKNGDIIGNTFIATSTDRHAVYASVNQPSNPSTSGWNNLRIMNNNVDWTATNAVNDDSKIPFNLRAGTKIVISGNNLKGGAGGITILNSDGPLNDILITGNTHTGIQPQNGVIAAFVKSLSPSSGTTYPITNLEFTNNVFEVLKSASSPNGNDQGCRFVGVNGLRIVGNKHKVQTGAGYLIWNCSNILIDDIVEEVTDTATANTLGTRTVDFEGACSNITIGSIKTNRLDRSDEKVKTIFGLVNCTDVTCLFPRYIEFTLTNGVVSLVKDDYDIISSGGIAFGTGSIQITVRNHVTDAAIAGCTVYSRAANGVYVQKTAVTGKVITMSFVVSSTGSLQSMSTYTGRVGVTFYA